MEKRLQKLLIVLTAVLFLSGCFIRRPGAPAASMTPSPAVTATPAGTASPSAGTAPSAAPAASASPGDAKTIPEDTRCDDKACVALYIYTWKHLPANFMTKKQARKIGWKRGPLSKVKKGMAIGGDYYGNYEGNLPDKYEYRECDVNTTGRKKRKTERIVYSENGEVVYYTNDHYQTFELLYGKE